MLQGDVCACATCVNTPYMTQNVTMVLQVPVVIVIFVLEKRENKRAMMKDTCSLVYIYCLTDVNCAYET